MSYADKLLEVKRESGDRFSFLMEKWYKNGTRFQKWV